MIPRVRRARPVNKDTLAPPAESVKTPPRIRRERVKTDALGRTRYVIDWGISLEAKLQLYLMTSYLYYYMNRSIIADSDFDRLCKELAAGWRSIKHQHKGLTDKEQLEAGTGYAIKYPMMVVHAARYMLDRHYEI